MPNKKGQHFVLPFFRSQYSGFRYEIIYPGMEGGCPNWELSFLAGGSSFGFG